MVYVGIDYSRISPAICKHDTENNSINFVSFCRDSLPKKILFLSDCSNYKHINYPVYVDDDEYTDKENSRCLHSLQLAKIVSNEIPDNSIVFIEGYSYGSVGNEFINLIVYQHTLRLELLQRNIKFKVFTPREIKKAAGIKKSDKREMLLSFLNQDDEKVIKTDLYKNIINNKDILLKTKKIDKPLDDCIDSYFILKKGLEHA